MNIVITFGHNRDDQEWQKMVATWEEDGEMKSSFVSVFPLCEMPEDAIIGRGLLDCEDIVIWMERAYNAGLAGLDFNVRYIEEK